MAKDKSKIAPQTEGEITKKPGFDHEQASQIKASKTRLARLTLLFAIFFLGFTAASLSWIFIVNPKQHHVAMRNKSPDLSKTEDKQSESTWVDYRNEEARLEFKHPKEWISSTQEALYDEAGELGEVSGEILSPGGKKLEWVYTAWGGKGGGCDPGEDDVPFADGNECDSKTIFSAEVLPVPAAPQSKLLDGNNKGLVLTTTKHEARGDDGPTSYQICVDDFYLSEPRVIVGTRMELLFPCEYWSTGFNARFEVENEQAFDSEDAKVAEQIMRTFKSF